METAWTGCRRLRRAIRCPFFFANGGFCPESFSTPSHGCWMRDGKPPWCTDSVSEQRIVPFEDSTFKSPVSVSLKSAAHQFVYSEPHLAFATHPLALTGPLTGLLNPFPGLLSPPFMLNSAGLRLAGQGSEVERRRTRERLEPNHVLPWKLKPEPELSRKATNSLRQLTRTVARSRGIEISAESSPCRLLETRSGSLIMESWLLRRAWRMAAAVVMGHCNGMHHPIPCANLPQIKRLEIKKGTRGEVLRCGFNDGRCIVDKLPSIDGVMIASRLALYQSKHSFEGPRQWR